MLQIPQLGTNTLSHHIPPPASLGLHKADLVFDESVVAVNMARPAILCRLPAESGHRLRRAGGILSFRPNNFTVGHTENKNSKGEL